jgi:hypothetical protein
VRWRLWRDSYGPGASWHPGPTGAAGAAARASEDQAGWVAAEWQLAADSLDDQRGQGDLADAGVALGSRLEAAAEPTGLIPGVDDLEHRQAPVEADTPAVQPGQLPEPQAGAEQTQHVVPPEQMARLAIAEPTTLTIAACRCSNPRNRQELWIAGPA